MATTKIEWTDMAWNPISGCTKVSQGCKNCYAERMAKRLAGRNGYPADEPFRVMLHPEKLEEPLHWKRPSRIFVDSMGDLFHRNLVENHSTYIDEIFAIMAATPQHTYQILTKRPWLMRDYLADGRRDVYVEHALEMIYGEHGWCAPEFEWPLPNVWIGTSIEDQKTANHRIPLLLETPAAVRFISCEPLLGQIGLRPFEDFSDVGHGCQWLGEAIYETIDWVIVGGETGPGSRPMHPGWVRNIRDQCQAAYVPFFFKSWGDWYPGVIGPDYGPIHEWPDKWASQLIGKKEAGRLLDGKVWDELPREHRT